MRAVDPPQLGGQIGHLPCGERERGWQYRRPSGAHLAGGDAPGRIMRKGIYHRWSSQKGAISPPLAGKS